MIKGDEMDKPITDRSDRCRYCSKCVGVTHNIFYLCEVHEYGDGAWECRDYCTTHDTVGCVRYARAVTEESEREARNFERKEKKRKKKQLKGERSGIRWWQKMGFNKRREK